MKKIFTALLLCLALLLAIPTTASANFNKPFYQISWTVELKYNGLTKKYELKSNDFSSEKIAETLGNLQPGDDVKFEITLQNNCGNTADWYLNNIIEPLEESSTSAKYGGYTYKLIYQGSGDPYMIYDSDKVGGAKKGSDGQEVTSPAGEGLNEIKDALKDDIYMGRLNSGSSGTLTLYVALDGESQDNSYWKTNGELDLQFAVEIVPTNTRVVATGDSGVRLNAVYIGMAVAGFLVLGLAIDGVVQDRKKRKKGPAA